MPLPPEIPIDAKADIIFVGDDGGGLDIVAQLEILGQRVRRIKGRHHGGWSYHDRIHVKCKCPEHDGDCEKSRSLALDVDIFGGDAALFFLSVWLLAGASLNSDEHKAFVPSRAEMRAFVTLERH